MTIDPTDLSAVALTPGQMVMVDTDGKPANASNTDTQVAATVTASHAKQHALDSTIDHTIGGLSTANLLPKSDGTKLVPSVISDTGTSVTIAAGTEVDGNSLTVKRNSTDAGEPTLGGFKSRGTLGTPVDIVVNDGVASFYGYGYLNGDYRALASIQIFMRDAASGSHAGTAIKFVTDDGSASAERVRITPSGQFAIGIADPLSNLGIAFTGSGDIMSLLSGGNKLLRFNYVNGSTYNMEINTLNSGSSLCLNSTSLGPVGICTLTPLAKLAINGGCHIGGDSDPGDNNIQIDGQVIGQLDMAAGVRHSGIYVHTGYTGAGLAVTVDTTLYSGISWRPSNTPTGPLVVTLSNGTEGQEFKVFNPAAYFQTLHINAACNTYNVGTPGCGSGTANALFVYDYFDWRMLAGGGY